MSDTVAEKKVLVLDEAGRAHINSSHRLGRIGIVIAAIIMLGIPVITGIYFNAMPAILQILTTSISLFALFAPTAFSETIAYSSTMGSSYYLSQITGNIGNLKFPVAKSAIQFLNVEEGTEDADIISCIAVGISSFVTIIVIVLGVALLQPLRPVLSLPAVRLASANIVPALFGSLIVGALGSRLGGGITSRGRWKGAVLPFAIVAAIYLIAVYVVKRPEVFSVVQGLVMLLLLPVAWFSNKWLYKTGRITVMLPGGDTQR